MPCLLVSHAYLVLKNLAIVQIAQAPNGSKQALEAAETARLSLTTAAALAFQETSQIPGITDSPQSLSTDNPASATFEGHPLGWRQLEKNRIMTMWFQGGGKERIGGGSDLA